MKHLVVSWSLLLAVTACGDGSDSGDDAGSEPSPSGGAVATASGDPSAPASAEESAEPSPTPALEMGQVIEVEAARLQGPKGWTSDDAPTDTVKVLQSPDDIFAYVSLSETEDELGITETDIRRKGKVALDYYSSSPGVRLRKPAALGGVPSYHLSGPLDEYMWVEKFGVTHNGYSVSVQSELPLEYPPARRQKIIDSVLATFEWK